MQGGSTREMISLLSNASGRTKQQNYPWQSKFKAKWAWSQPFLFHGDPVSARAVELIESMEDA